MKPEILWNNDITRDFLNDLKSFAMSLDNYQIVWDLENSNEKKYVWIKDSEYEILSEQNQNSFKCPVCENTVFDVMEGEFQGKPVIGLACRSCETCGAVFPDGM